MKSLNGFCNLWDSFKVAAQTSGHGERGAGGGISELPAKEEAARGPSMHCSGSHLL